MKKIANVLLVFLLTLSVVACGSNNSASTNQKNTAGNTPKVKEPIEEAKEPVKADKLRIAYHPNMGGSSAIITGIKMDFFKEQNLDIELVKFTSGPTEIAAMISGDIDLGYVGHGAHFLAVQGKVNIISLDALSNSEELLVRKDSGITKVEDLKGKTVATQFGTSGDILIQLALKRANMTKEDIKLVNMDMAGAVSAFIANKVDAVSVWSPYTHEIKKEMDGQVDAVVNTMTFSDEFVFPSSWIVTPNYLKENEDLVLRYLKGLFKSMDYRAEHLEEVVEWVAELNSTPIDSVSLEKISGNWLTGKSVYKYFEDGTAKNWYEKQQKLFLDSGVLEKGAPVEDYVAFNLVKKVLE